MRDSNSQLFACNTNTLPIELILHVIVYPFYSISNAYSHFTSLKTYYQTKHPSASVGTRTLNLTLKRGELYQLSYKSVVPLKGIEPLTID